LSSISSCCVLCVESLLLEPVAKESRQSVTYSNDGCYRTPRRCKNKQDRQSCQPRQLRYQRKRSSMRNENAPSLEPNRQTGPTSYELTNFGRPTHHPSFATLNSQYSAESSKYPRNKPSFASFNSLRSTQKQRVIEDKNDEDEQRASLEPVRSRQPNVNDASQIPNGGLWAWLQVVGAFFLMFNSWGVSNVHI
jgi:hypothetical protein